MRRAAEAVLLHVALVAGAVLTLVPLLWMVSASLMPAGEATAVPPRLLPLAVPPQVAMLPLFLMLKELRLVNTYAGVMIPGMASVFGIFLVRQYALSLPDSVLDAARIDGAGEFRIYRSLVLYLCAPILVTL